MSKSKDILCPFCSSHSVIKKGLKSGKQRYQCKYCRKKFCNTQKHNHYKLIYEFLLNKTLRNFENTSKDLLYRNILSVIKNLPSLDVLNTFLNIRFSGRIALDAIFISVEGKSAAVLIALDLESLDIIDFTIASSESEESWYILIKRLNISLNNTYPKIFVCDGKRGLNNVLRNQYEFVPRQVCIAHKLRRLDQIYPMKNLSDFDQLTKESSREAILATSQEEFNFWQDHLNILIKSNHLRSINTTKSIQELRKAYKARGVLRYQKSDFLTQFKYPDLVKNDRTNNCLEGLNSILKTRIRLFRGFKSKENVEFWLRLIIYFYRFHKFKSSKYKWRNGRTPIETNNDIDLKQLEKIVEIKSYSWIENLYKFTQSRSPF